MRVLITGATGSGGSYLAEYLAEHQPQVKISGTCRWHSATTEKNLFELRGKIKLFECDLCDLSSVIYTLKAVKPDRIFHLAAYANVRKCFDTPLSVVQNNVMGTANLLEGIRLICPETVLQMCSTSEVYGTPQYSPMDEGHPLRPVNPYAASKLAQESLAYAYFKSWNLHVVITRMFAYINPKRADLFATAFAKQVAEVRAGKREVIEHGNLDSLRTLIDVRDAMESYWVASEKCFFGEAYNIGGLAQVTVGGFLDVLQERALGKKVSCFQNPDLLRPTDVTHQVPDSTKFTERTGWRPKYSLEESIDFLMSYCEKHYV